MPLDAARLRRLWVGGAGVDRCRGSIDVSRRLRHRGVLVARVVLSTSDGGRCCLSPGPGFASMRACDRS